MRDKIIDILNGIRPEFDFTESVDFIEEGMLDSFDIVALVDSLESEFGVIVSGTDVVPENFCSVDAILRMIETSKK